MGLRRVRVRAIAFGTALVVSAAGSLACATRGAVPRPFPGATTRGSTPAPAGAATTADRRVPPVVSTALALRGSPYRNGGSEPTGGFDCSGLVQWVFSQHGTRLPREVREQFELGHKIQDADVRAGDLVFFSTVSPGASHVGIALGAGNFVHAPSTRGVVRIESYKAGYWAARWIGARRIVEGS